jgi:hypothetical protein
MFTVKRGSRAANRCFLAKTSLKRCRRSAKPLNAARTVCGANQKLTGLHPNKQMNPEFIPTNPNFRPPSWVLNETRRMRGLEDLDICPPAGVTEIRTYTENFSADVKKRYSLSKALLEGSQYVSGLEREVSHEIALKTGKTPKGFYAPVFALTRDLAAALVLHRRAVQPARRLSR